MYNDGSIQLFALVVNSIGVKMVPIFACFAFSFNNLPC